MSGPSTITEDRLLYLNIAISENGLSELSRGKRIVFVPKEHVKSVELKYGCQAENPLTQIVFGLVLVAVGVVGVIFLKGGGFALLRLGVGFLLFGCLGAFCVYEGVKKGYYLDVISTNDRRKLVFKGTVDKSALLSFINNSSRFGYNFQSRL